MLKLAASLIAFAVVVGLAGSAYVALVVLDAIRVVAGQGVALVGFLLETWVPQVVVGAWVAFQLQERSAANSRRRDRLQLAYDRKVEATTSFYALVEKRIYASRRYLAVIESEPKVLADERTVYRAVVAEWNEKIKISQVPLLLEFDSYIGLSLDHDYFPTFRSVDAKLRQQRLLIERGKAPDSAVSVAIRKHLFDLNKLSLEMVREMLKQAQRDRNIMDEEVEISEENLAHLTYGRLFKAILQPT